jgi:AcrR family transcriptional regulator
MAEQPRRAKSKASKSRAELGERIVDAAVALAEEVGWGAVRLRLVAERLDVPLRDVLAHYRDLDGVANAWFRRAWAAMLAPPPKDFAALPARERVFTATMRWFDALAAHREVSGQMLAAKLYPSHPHHWVPMAFNLSRTIHWLREAAMLDATGRRRQMEEVGLTGLFLATLAVWLRDESPAQEHTRRFLRARLDDSDRLMVRVWGRRAPAERKARSAGRRRAAGEREPQ